MMNNTKLVVTVIILCIVSPIMIGYAWPVDSTSETAWETGDPKDISRDAINAKLPVYVPYNDPFNNNINLFEPNSYFYNSIPVMVTGNPGPVWSTLNPDGHGYESVYIPNSGVYTISDISTWTNWNGASSVIISMWDEWVSSITIDGVNVDLVVYYPQTDKLYYRGGSGVYGYYPTETHEIKINAFSTYYGTTQDLYYIAYFDEGYYADLSYGIQTPSAYSDWFNGYQNKGANIIFNTVDSDLAEFVYIHDPSGYDDTIVSLWIDTGTIRMTLWADSVPYYTGALGSYDIYDKVLLTIDYDTASIVLTGLRNMDSFLGDYNAAMRDSIKADWQDPVIFRSFSIEKQAGNNAAFYVANTLSAIAETDGSRNYEMDLRDYTANGSCQLNIRNVTQHGDNLSLMINTTYKLGTISKGELTIAGVDETITVPVNNMLIGLIGNKVYLNGYLLFEASNITKVNINFYDDWKMSLIYYPVTETSVSGYSWLPGGFGLDVNGFCMVGLITSALSGLAASLYGRRSGAKMVFVTFTSGIIAAVYLIILMGGL